MTPKTIWISIENKANERGIHYDELANAMRISKSTYYNRKNDPDTLTLGEIEKASRLFGISLKDIFKENEK